MDVCDAKVHFHPGSLLLEGLMEARRCQDVPVLFILFTSLNNFQHSIDFYSSLQFASISAHFKTHPTTPLDPWLQLLGRSPDVPPLRTKATDHQSRGQCGLCEWGAPPCLETNDHGLPAWQLLFFHASGKMLNYFKQQTSHCKMQVRRQKQSRARCSKTVHCVPPSHLHHCWEGLAFPFDSGKTPSICQDFAHLSFNWLNRAEHFFSRSNRRHWACMLI